MASKKILVSLGWFMATLCCIFGIVTKGVYASQHLRGENTDFLEEIPSTQSDRELRWMYLPESKTLHDDRFYSHYDDKEVKQTKALDIGDPEDFLRDSDVCPKKGRSGFKRSYCPKPPDCNWSGKWGKAKLCITRIPFPWNHSKYYVLAMKCIPKWENCDKCVCGYISGNKCKFNGSTWDDDRFKVNCDNPKTIKLNGFTYQP